jgi:hypothetical protein
MMIDRAKTQTEESEEGPNRVLYLRRSVLPSMVESDGSTVVPWDQHDAKEKHTRQFTDVTAVGSESHMLAWHDYSKFLSSCNKTLEVPWSPKVRRNHEDRAPSRPR